MIHSMKLCPKPFEMVKNGSKTFELRLLDEKRQKVRVGDIIIFQNTEDPFEQVEAKVVALHPFPSFAELYCTLPLERCGYTKETAKTAHPSDMEEYYSPKEQAEYGVLAIEIERVLEPKTKPGQETE